MQTTFRSKVARLSAFVAASVLAAAAPMAATAAYPEKPIRLVVPFAPGGGTDLIARTLGADNRFNLAQYPEANRQPGVNAGGGLADEAGPQHQLVADNLGLGRGFPGHGQEISGHAHGAAV